MNTCTDTIRSAFLPMWWEYVVWNTRDVDGSEVVAQGQQSGRYYILTLDDDRITDAEPYT